MAGRPTQKKANIKAIKKLPQFKEHPVDTRPLIAYVMYNSGCTYAEIGKVFDVTRQMAETLVKSVEKTL